MDWLEVTYNGILVACVEAILLSGYSRFLAATADKGHCRLFNSGQRSNVTLTRKGLRRMKWFKEPTNTPEFLCLV